MDLSEDVLYTLFTYFKPKELLVIRLTCKSWDSVISRRFGKYYKINIKTIDDDVKKITNSNSSLISSITAVQLSVNQFEDNHKIVYKDMFEKVKPLKTFVLHASHNKFVSSVLCEFTSYFSQLESFILASSIEPEIIQRVKFSDFTSVRNLTIIATEERSEFGQIDFLEKFLQENHHLRSLILKRHFCVSRLPLTVIRNAFKSKYLEKLHLDLYYYLEQDHILSIIESDSNNLKHLKAPIREVDKPKLYRCLNKYKDSLETLVLESSDISMEYVPILNNLRYLDIKDVHFSAALNVAFCTKLPALKTLILGNAKRYVRDHFVHTNLELLDLRSVSHNDVNNILQDVPFLFPNLKTIVIKGNLHFNCPIEFLEARGITVK